MKTVFVAGNPLMQKDSLALKIAKELGKELKGVEFKQIDSLSSLKEIPKEFVLLDVAEGIEKVEEITDLGKLQELKLLSLHDFDLGTELLLYKKLGKLEKVVLIAVPSSYPLEKAMLEVKAILLSKSVWNS